MNTVSAWCRACRAEMLVTDTGACRFCGGPTGKKRGGGRPAGKHGRIKDPELRVIHRAYVEHGLSCRELGRRLYERFGYKTPRSCGEALYHGFKRLELPLRSQREVTIARNLKHGRKRRGNTNEDEQAYRRWLRDQRGWRAIQGPGQPTCKGILTGARGRKGKPCSRPAITGSDYCASYDPALERDRQAALAAARRNLPPRNTLPLEPFAAWVDGLYHQLGTLAAVGKRLGCSKATVDNIVKRRRTLPDRAGRGPWTEIDRRKVERYLDAAGGPPLEDLYAEQPMAVAA